MKKYGKRFGVLLLSADAGYAGNTPEVHKRVKETLAKFGAGWNSVVVPDGWEGINRTFGQDGYILTLVDAQGIVRAVNVRGEDLDSLVNRYAPPQPRQSARTPRSTVGR
jgi:hypothetical protein